jgi:ribonucleoside-diphosphate reductase alpha chain
MRMHADASAKVNSVAQFDRDILDLANKTWEECLSLGEVNGYRNAQASLLAPTGTIGFMMDCDTTGIEPDLALVKFKKLVGGGSMQIVNQTVPRALKNLGYQPEQAEAITEYIAEHGHVVNAPGLRHEHYEVFDCAMGERSISPMGHVRMMAAVQPFLSGSISKTVNMPESATVEDVEQIYFEGWKLGLKALAIYRDNCKVGQPLSAKKKNAAEKQEAAPVQTTPAAAPEPHEHRPVRRRLPKTRSATVTRFDVAGAEGYMTASTYPDDGVGEIFLKLGKQGSTLAGVMDAFSMAISVGLQYGIPLESYVGKFTNMRFEPAGMTDDPDIRIATSVMDYIFRRLALDHLPYEQRAELGILSAPERAAQLAGQDPASLVAEVDPVELAQSAAVETSASTERVHRTPSASMSTASAPSASSAASQPSATAVPAGVATPVSRTGGPHSTAELIEFQQGRTADAPLCLTCGTKMRPAGSCYVCEGCGSTSGCS